MARLLLSFLAVCAATAFVITSVKEDSPRKLASASSKLLVALILGIGLFAGVIEVFTLLAG